MLWQTEKMEKLKFTDPITSKEVTAKWSNLTVICKIENDSLCKLIKLNHATLYPNNLEKQKVDLVLNICNEKTAAFFDLKSYNDTANICEISNHTLELN